MAGSDARQTISTGWASSPWGSGLAHRFRPLGLPQRCDPRLRHVQQAVGAHPAYGIGEGFLGDDSSLVDLSPETQRDVEQAVRGMITAAQEEATGILRSHRRELDTLAARLDAEETLEDEVLQEALAPLLSAIESKSATGTAGAPAPRRKAAAGSSRTVNGNRSRAAAKS